MSKSDDRHPGPDNRKSPHVLLLQHNRNRVLKNRSLTWRPRRDPGRDPVFMRGERPRHAGIVSLEGICSQNSPSLVSVQELAACNLAKVELRLWRTRVRCTRFGAGRPIQLAPATKSAVVRSTLAGTGSITCAVVKPELNLRQAVHRLCLSAYLLLSEILCFAA
jgi:hypothetical protein